MKKARLTQLGEEIKSLESAIQGNNPNLVTRWRDVAQNNLIQNLGVKYGIDALAEPAKNPKIISDFKGVFNQNAAAAYEEAKSLSDQVDNHLQDVKVLVNQKEDVIVHHNQKIDEIKDTISGLEKAEPILEQAKVVQGNVKVVQAKVEVVQEQSESELQAISNTPHHESLEGNSGLSNLHQEVDLLLDGETNDLFAGLGVFDDDVPDQPVEEVKEEKNSQKKPN